jgi:hypothetical protein
VELIMDNTIITVEEPFNTPNGNRAQWIKLTLPSSKIKRANYVLAARARKIAKSLGPNVKAAWLTGGATLGPDTTEVRTLYVFHQE